MNKLSLMNDRNPDRRRTIAVASCLLVLMSLTVFLASVSDRQRRDRDSLPANVQTAATIPELMEALQTGRPVARCRAADQLGRIGPRAEYATSALVHALENDQVSVQISAAFALGRIHSWAVFPFDRLEVAPESVVSALRKALRYGDRQQAARALGALGRIATDAVPDLVLALRDKDERVRTNAAYALGQIRADSQDAVAALASSLKDSSPETRFAAAHALGCIGPPASSATVQLASALNDSENDVRRRAAMTLGRIGPGAVAAVPALKAVCTDWEVMREALQGLGGIGPAAQTTLPFLLRAIADRKVYGDYASSVFQGVGPDIAIPVLMDTLKHPRLHDAVESQLRNFDADTVVPVLEEAAKHAPDEATRAGAMRVLRLVGHLEPDLAPELFGDLDSEHAELRAVAVGRLENMNVTHAVPALIKALSDESAQVQNAAAWVLSEMGEDATDAVPALIKAFETGDESVRGTILYTLLQLRTVAEPATAVMVEALGDDSEEIRFEAARVLAWIGSAAMPAVFAALSDERDLVRAGAARATGFLYDSVSAPITNPPDEKVVAALTDRLTDSSAQVRENSARALGELAFSRYVDKESKSAMIAPLISALTDDQTVVRKEAASALEEFGDEAAEAVPMLVELLQNDNRDVSWSATSTLSEIGESASDAFPAILEVFRNDTGTTRRHAKSVLYSIAPHHPDAVPALMECLQHDDAMVRVEAGSLLLALDIDPHRVIPAIVKALNTPDISARMSATAILRQYSSHPATIAAVPALIRWIEEDSDSREDAAFTLEQIGPAAVAAVPALIDMVADEDVETWNSAVEALEAIGSEEAVPVIVDALSRDDTIYENHLVISYTIGSLLKFDPKVVVPELRRALDHGDADLRSGAIQAMTRLGRDANVAIPQMINAIVDPHSQVRAYAIEAAQERRLVSAIPLIVAAMEDESQYVRRCAREALLVLSPDHEALQGE